jgi:tetratricopeptide (TPR) repeat protein
MLTLCLYVYYTEKPVIRRYLLVLFCFVLALLSKPMVVTLPVVMILLDYWPLSRLTSRKIAPALTEVESASANKEKKKTKAKKEALENNIPSSNVGKLPETRIAGVMPLWQIWEKAPFFILSAILIIITLYTTDKQETTLQGLPLASRLANAPVAFVTYLEKTFWPRDLAVFYPFSAGLPAWQVLGTILLIIVISIAVIVKARRMPFLFAGWLWYAVTILPVIGIIQISFMAPYSMADRYHYLPSIGIAVILAWGIPYLFERKGMRKEILLPVSLVFIAVLSFLTWRQCGCWKNSTALWNHALQATENNYLAHNNLGNALYEEGKIKDALYYFNEAISINPDFAKLYYSRGNAYYKLGQFQLAIDDYSKAITMNPYYAGAYCNRGIVYDEKGQYRLAMEDYTQTIRLKPDYIEAYVNRGTVYGKNGQYQSAIEDYSEAILLKPDDADFYNSRAIIYFNQGNKELGCLDCQKACELGNCTILESARARGFCR